MHAPFLLESVSLAACGFNVDGMLARNAARKNAMAGG